MIRIIRLAILFAIAAALVYSAQAQTWAPVAPESTSTTLTIPAGTTYQLGAAACAATGSAAWSAPVTVTSATTFSPLSMSVSGVFPFNDPCAQTLKTLQVLETAAPQVLTLNGAAFQVPALAPVLTLQNCPAPATFNANPTTPAAPPNCAPLANEIPVSSDGSKITDLAVATPMFFQYCTGSGTGQICDAPFMFVSLPIVVGPTAQNGGPPVAGNASPGTLYAVQAAAQNTVLFTDQTGAAQTLVVPVTGGP